jgi:pimeloyl-ACP methyl ester carboxylesterase
LTRDRLLEIIFNALYDANAYTNLANALDAASKDVSYLLTPFIHDYLATMIDDRFGDGLSTSIHCQEDVMNYVLPETNVPRTFVPSYFVDLQQDMKTTCGWLNLEPKITSAQPRHSIPTLILAGALDPRQAVDHGRYWNEWFEQSALVVFPNESHYLEWDECTTMLVNAFVKGESIDEQVCSGRTYYVEK